MKVFRDSLRQVENDINNLRQDRKTKVFTRLNNYY
jgi:hypothetical protein